MKRILIITSVLLSTVSFCKTHNSKQENVQLLKSKDKDEYYGKWKITKFVPGTISEITEKDAEEYLGRVVILKPDIVIINGDTCNKPYFKMSTKNSDNYFFENNRIDKASLQINQDSIRIVEISCKESPKYFNRDSSNFAYDFIVIDNNLMIVGFKGFYFYLERVMKAL